MKRACVNCFFARRDHPTDPHFVCFGVPPSLVPVSKTPARTLMLNDGARIATAGEMTFQNVNVRVPLDYPGCGLWQCRECYGEHDCPPVVVIRHTDDCPVNQPGFVPSMNLNESKCTCDFGKRLKDYLENAPNSDSNC